MKFGANEDAVAVFGRVEEPPRGCEVSRRVMVNADGILPDPLCFRRFEGPVKPVGDACLDRLRGVSVADVVDDAAEGTTKGLGEDAIGKFGLKLCCNPCRSVVERDCLNIFEPIGWPPDRSKPAVEKTPAPGS